VLGLSIGGGEFLLGPAVFVRYGLTLLWVTVVSVFFQTLFNTELMRYTVATGEPVFTGYMRTRPSPGFWAFVYGALYFLQTGWPASAGVAAGAIFFVLERRLPTAADASEVYWIGVGTFACCVMALLAGRRIERTLEILNWILVTCILGGLSVLAVAYVPAGIWASAFAGLAGFDMATASFEFAPDGVDFVLLAALVAYSGAGGAVNITLSNWARDKGYGMGQKVGYIPAAVGGHKVHLAHTGFTFTPDPENMRRWNGWWRIVRADQWGVFFTGALLGMLLPAVLYVSFLPGGTDIQGLGVSAALAERIGARSGPLIAGMVAVMGAWLLFKTQLDILEGMVRTMTDMLWTGSARFRTWRGGDIRAIYYGVLAVIAGWGAIALRAAPPIALLKLAANVAAVIFVIASLHLLYVNTRFLPKAIQPPLWRRVGLVAMAIFYSFFAILSIGTLL
jgi:hypothetical protein